MPAHQRLRMWGTLWTMRQSGRTWFSQTACEAWMRCSRRRRCLESALCFLSTFVGLDEEWDGTKADLLHGCETS